MLAGHWLLDRAKAGQGAAERFYEWEEKYQVQVSVARFPEGQDPGELSLSDPVALRDADHALLAHRPAHAHCRRVR